MGHLRASINPAAMDVVNGSIAPGVATSVVYCARPGEWRRGRAEFPAIVMHRHEDGQRLDLLVLYDADEQILREMIEPATDTNTAHVWKLPEGAQSTEFAPSSLHAVRLQAEALGKAIFGDYSPPEKAVMEYLAQFEAELQGLRAKVAAMEKAPQKVMKSSK